MKPKNEHSASFRGYIVGQTNYRHHRRLPGAKLPPLPEFWSAKIDNPQITWVNKPDDPLDLRSTAPVARHKPLDKGNIQLGTDQSNWIPQEEIPVGEKSRKDKGTEIYPYHQRTRCEEWSTLRQQLPSIGHIEPGRPADWNQQRLPRRFSTKREKRFPRYNSEMTRYVDDMLLTTRLFTFH